MPPARFIQLSKNIPLYRISEQHTDWQDSTGRMLFLFGLFVYRLFRQSLVSAAVGVHCTDVKGERFSG